MDEHATRLDRDEPQASAPPDQGPWWRDGQRRNIVAMWVFGALALGGILFPAFTNYLFAGDNRVLVVTMGPTAGQEGRQAVKDDCGALPGIRVVADRGNPDPRIQGRFPVRFDIADSTPAQQAALQSCVNDHESDGVVGFITEGDGN